MNPHLSIVIPAFNEDQLNAINAFISTQRYTTEILVVDDGSCDNTAEIVTAFASSHPYVQLIRLPTHQGKGAAICTGMLSAQGDYRLFTDADNSTPIVEATKLLAVAETDADVVVGSRHLPGSKIVTKQHIAREALGALFRLLIRFVAPTGIRDTQNGFKLFRAHAAETLFGELVCAQWAFDVEILRRARNHDLIIAEVPVTWINDSRSKIRYSHMVPMLIDSIAIAWRTRGK